ncbi:hypothetical protein FEM03_05495 [Phragmitibacter flavus]|uniref:Immunity protein 52 domain-containing protein n=1 Tax=Phragmitibacter flavus TaxID=2576071 RepID=A0A5R8KH61_9BACT|nr:Imm52 family immunity protein [Phragmitibacter flavus]TLD71597.1 hypothetical protein FEM03_05495 [Phragmitibacter flavus]
MMWAAGEDRQIVNFLHTDVIFLVIFLQIVNFLHTDVIFLTVKVAIDGVKADGTLIEAKGSYTDQFKYGFKNAMDGLIIQARKQIMVAESAGVRLEYHWKNASEADSFRELLIENGIDPSKIDIIHTPAEWKFMSNIYIGVYWGSRLETDEAIAAKIKNVLTGVASINPRIHQWFELDTHKGKPPIPLAVDIENLQRILRKRRGGNDCKGIQETFKSDIQWNKSISVSFAMGHHNVSAGPNSCVVKANGQREIVEPLSMEGLWDVLKLLVAVMSPDDGFVQDRIFINSIEHLRNKLAFFGWITYKKDIDCIKPLLGNDLSLSEGNYLLLGCGLPPKSCDGMDINFLMKFHDAMARRD